MIASLSFLILEDTMKVDKTKGGIRNEITR